MRECDGCTLCCTVLGVTDDKLKKAANTACVHCEAKGCRVHDDPSLFPKSCGDFECGYLLSELPVEFRPDKCHIIITGEDAELETHFLHVDPAHPYAPNTAVGNQLIQLINQVGIYPNILLTTGNKDRIISRDPAAAKKLRRKLDLIRKQNK